MCPGVPQGESNVNTTTRRRATRLPLLATAIAFAFVTNLAAAPGKPPRADLDRFIVKFKNGSAEHGNAAQRQRKLDAVGNDQGLHLGQLRRLAVGADVIKSDRKLTAQQAKDLIGRLRADPRVEYAEIDARMVPDFVPNDTYYSLQWHYNSALAGINLPLAWDTTSGTGEVVAVLDTGYIAHPDLVGNVIAGYDFVSEDAPGVYQTANDGDGRDANPLDPGDWTTTNMCGAGVAARASSWHGTHTAGTIGAVTNNASGVAGVAYGAKVQPLRVLGRCGGYTSDIADAIVWASGGSVPGIPDNTTPASVMNLSLSGGGSCAAISQAAIDIAVANGATVVVSAGNQGIDTAGRSPASCNNVVNVAASNKLGAKASYSNFGTLVDVTAPGGESGTNGVVSTWASSTSTSTLTGYGYAYLAGTSMAAPHVAGTAALIQAAAGGTLTPANVEGLLKSTSRALPVECPAGCGQGLIDAAAAVGVVAGGAPYLYMVAAGPVTEGDAGTKVVTFTVALSEPVGSDVSFDFATADGSATAGSDYVARSETGQVIAAGDTTASFDVTINGDTDFELGEGFSAEVSNVSGIAVVKPSATAGIVNDDQIVLANAVPVTGMAYGQQVLFNLPVPANASNLKFQITGGTGDADLYIKYGSVPTLSTFDCRPWLTGNNETCAMPSATQGTWYGMIDPYAAYTGVSLVGSYEVPVDISIDDPSVTEGDAGTQVVTFTVSLSQATAVATTYDISTAGDTATSDDDFASASATGETIPAGQTTKTFSVTVNGDTAIEDDEQFFVDLANASANGTITDAQGTGTITNDDFPSLSIDDQSSDEGDSGTTQHTFTASLDQAAPFDVTFDVATTGGSATADDDFASSSATGVTIAAGNTTATFAVDVNGDTAVEGDESYTVDLANAVNANVADGSGTGTINNDDYPTLSISDATVTEGNAGTTTMTFTVSLDTVAAKPVTFDVATTNGSALAGSDYVAGSATGEVIPAGQLSTTFSVAVNGDGAMERDEILYAVISNATEANIGDPLGAGTITNDDGTLSVADAVATFEGDTGTKMMTFVVSLSQVSTEDVTFNAKTHPNAETATPGVDFTPVSLTGLVIPAGQLSMAVSVPIIGDTGIEPDETVRLNVGSGTAFVSDGKAYGTIINDDGNGKLTIADAGFVEGDSGSKTLNFTVTLSSAMATPVTFNIFTVNGMAVAGEDYTAKTVTGATIPAGQTTYTFSLTTFGDTKIEGNETLFVRLSNASVPVLDGQAKGLLVNDDGPVLSISDASVTEGDSGTKLMTFTVSISKPATAKVTFNFTTINDTAVAGSDFDPVSVTGLVIPYGQVSRTVSVPIRGDTNVEANETLRAAISLGNVSIQDGVGIGTIVNDDPAP
jgi:serine protease